MKTKKFILPIIMFIALLIFATSCSSIAESEYNKVSWELKKKNLELDYLERLYQVKSDIEFERKIKTMDSLIFEFKLNHLK